jgi:hypothetical protein
MSDGESRVPSPGRLNQELLRLDETGKLAQQDARATELEARIAQLEVLAMAHRAIPIDPGSREDH